MHPTTLSVALVGLATSFTTAHYPWSRRTTAVQKHEMDKRASDPRDSMVAKVRAGAKKGTIAAQWYPGYNSDIIPVNQIDFDSADLVFWFVQTTTKDGLDTTVDGPLKDLVSAANKASVPVVATVGGWDGGLFFSSLVSTDSGRQSLAKQFAAFMDQYQLAGMEVDWEYPNQQGIGCNKISSSDLENFASFLSVLRKAVGDTRLLSIDVSSGGMIGKDGQVSKDLSDVAAPLDFINIMNYDTYGSWTDTSGPNAALDASCNKDAAVSAITSAQLYMNAKVPGSKLLMGMPGYGYSFTTTSSSLKSKNFDVTLSTGKSSTVSSKLYQAKKTAMPKGDDLDVPSKQPDVCGNVDPGHSGQFLYKSLIEYGFLTKDGSKGANGFTRYWDACTSTPFLFNDKNNTIVAYDDSSSLAIKASWAQDLGLAGTVIFDSSGPTKDVFQAVKAASSGAASRAKLWSMGISTIENATVVSDAKSLSISVGLNLGGDSASAGHGGDDSDSSAGTPKPTSSKSAASKGSSSTSAATSSGGGASSSAPATTRPRAMIPALGLLLALAAHM